MRILLALLLCSSWVLALTDQELISVRDGFDQRRDTVLDSQIANPYPDPATSVWGNLNFALAALYQNTRLDDANQAVADAYALYSESTQDFEWTGNHLTRIYEFFAADSLYWPGRLTADSEAKICELLYNWARANSKIVDTEIEQSRTWFIYGSENIDSQNDATCWGAARILSRTAPYNTMSYDDGFTISEHYAAWKAYYKEYFRERGRAGGVVEVSSSYNSYTMMGWYNIYDFETDLELKDLAGKTLDLYWADWAQEQLEGVRGGGKTRFYPNNATTASGDSIYSSSWFYVEKGSAGSKHPNQMMLATSGYRMPLVVMDMALDTQGRGAYEAVTRKLGLELNPRPDGLDDSIYTFDPENGGLSKYTFCTPDYIMGSLFMNKRPREDWTTVSHQNRWVGVIFSGHADARIYPDCRGTVAPAYSTHNATWSVQSKGTMITQKLSTSAYTDDMTVFFSSTATGLYRYEDSGWVFADVQNCYAAVKPAFGGYYWESENRMILREEYSPVVLEVALKTDYADLAAFKVDVKDNFFSYNDVTGEFVYEAIQSRGTLKFYAQSDDIPTINDEPINPQPASVYQSPFINSQWRSGVVDITKDERVLTLDFEPQTISLKTDMNSDGVVDAYDFLIFSNYWLINSENSGY
ncbi:MAG: hypothetical protein ACIAQZ_00655 [Sedimentisphaeraceae bacterium JB056]